MTRRIRIFQGASAIAFGLACILGAPAMLLLLASSQLQSAAVVKDQEACDAAL